MDTTHPDSDWKGSGQTLFPAFSLPVVTRGDRLIPLERALILSGHGAGGSGRSLWNVIADHVPELADHQGWQGVTFHNTLNMMTGTVGANSGAAVTPFIRARSAAAKIAAIRALPDASPAPGTVCDYQSTHSFVLSVAMNNLVRAREGPGADYWSMVEAAVLEPIGVPYLPVSRSIESDGSLGVPIMGWGGYPDVDAAAKVAQLLQGDGAHAGRQLLSRTKTRRRGAQLPPPDASLPLSSRSAAFS